MPLSPEDIQKLLKQDSERTRSGRKPKGSGGIDTSVRDYHTWHKLNHKLFDEDGPDGRALCSNPNCTDIRTGAKLVVEIAGLNMCRICFMMGYGGNGS